MSRTLTVSTIYRERAQHSASNRSARVPHLRLTGQWLAAAGFPPGAQVSVQVTNGQLVISAK